MSTDSTVKCPHCQSTLRCPPSKRGLLVACPRCDMGVQMPAIVPVAVPSQPAPLPVAVTPPAFVPEPAERSAYESPEPWYYGYLHSFAMFFVVLAVTIFVAAMCAVAIVVGIYLKANADGAAGGRNVDTALVAMTTGSAAYVFFILLVVLFQAGLILLAVDAARNIRRIANRR